MEDRLRLATSCLFWLLILLGGQLVAATAVMAGDLPGEGVLAEASPSASPASDDSSKNKEDQQGGDKGTAILFAVVALGVGGVGGFLIGRTRSSVDLPTPRSTVVQSPVPHDAGPQNTDKLIEGLIATFDVATTDAQRSRILATLREVSVTPIQPRAGEAFDPSRHQALGTEATADVGQAGNVVRIERPGWLRGNEVIRFAEVIIGE
jgi:GrpE